MEFYEKTVLEKKWTLNFYPNTIRTVYRYSLQLIFVWKKIHWISYSH